MEERLREETPDTLFGVRSAGGDKCGGRVRWRKQHLEPYHTKNKVHPATRVSRGGGGVRSPEGRCCAVLYCAVPCM